MCVLVVRSIENVCNSERMKRWKNKHTLTGDISCYYTKIMSCDMQIQRRSYSFCCCSAVLLCFVLLYTCFVFHFHFFLQSDFSPFPEYAHIYFVASFFLSNLLFHCYLRWIRWKTRKWIAFKWKNKHWTRISLAGSLCETNWSEYDVFGKTPKKSGEKCGFRSSLKII